MKLFSIMPRFADHIDEICEDIRYQVDHGITDCPLFSISLHPEGSPAVDKATDFAEDYLQFKRRLDSMGLKSGVLVQSTIGHGYKLASPSSFEKVVNLNDGAEETVCCPYGDDFCEYIKHAMAVIASCRPDCIMVDDDFRLIFRNGNGCACPLHMEAFNRMARTSMSREELFHHLKADNRSEYAKIYLETQKQSMLKAARAMREGIDSVDPKLPVAVCAAGNNAEFAVDIANILAGDGNPIVIRVSNGSYVPPGARFITRDFYRAAQQVVRIRDHADIMLAESDTCPQNRYAVSAAWFFSHYVGSMLEGTTGAKHWLTRLGTYEPQSGKAFRKILADHQGFLKTLSSMVSSLEYTGCRIPLSAEPAFFFSENGWVSGEDGGDGWSTHVLERFGLPLYFSDKAGGAAFMTDRADQKFTDDELKELFRSPLFLSSDSARRLIDRGFMEYIGVDVREWHGKQPTTERMYVNGLTANAQQKIYELVPMYPDVEIDSMTLNTVNKKDYEDLFPGTTVYKNKLGGTTVVFAGTPVTQMNYVEAFSFLTYSRKQQFIRLLRNLGQLPVFYPGDEELYLKAAHTPDGRMFVSLMNLSFDPIDEIRLTVEGKVSQAEILLPDGSFAECPFRTEGSDITLSANADPLQPVILLLKPAE